MRLSFSIFKYYRKNRNDIILKTTSTLLISFILLVVFLWLTGFLHASRLVTVFDGKQKIKFLSSHSDVSKLLQDKGIYLGQKDGCSFKDDGHDLNVNIKRAINVNISIDNQNKTLSIQRGKNVKEVLTGAGVVINEGEDKLNCSLYNKVYDGMEISVKKSSYVPASVRESIGHSTKYIYTDELFEGDRRLKVAGKDGEREKHFQDKVIDGNVVDRLEIGSTVISEPVDEEILVGKKKKVVTDRKASHSRPVDAVKKSLPGSVPVVQRNVLNLDSFIEHKNIEKMLQLPKPAVNKPKMLFTSPSVPFKFKRVISGRATAYSGGGITASGRPATRGLVAVNPKQIPIGSRLFIVAKDGYVYGEAVAADTGGAMLSGRVLVDLYMNSEAECLRFGNREVDVYVL